MKSKNGMIVGILSLALIGMGITVYNCVLSPKTKRKLMSLEEDMCEDFENMM